MENASGCKMSGKVQLGTKKIDSVPGMTHLTSIYNCRCLYAEGFPKDTGRFGLRNPLAKELRLRTRQPVPTWTSSMPFSKLQIGIGLWLWLRLCLLLEALYQKQTLSK